MQVEDVMKTLKEVPVGETVTVAKLVAPLGDPVEVTVRGYELTLRNGEAEHIVVE